MNLHGRLSSRWILSPVCLPISPHSQGYYMPLKDSVARKEYHKKYSKIHYQKNKDKYKTKAKISNKILYEKNRNHIRFVKSLTGCTLCGYRKCIEALEFHHPQNNKDSNIARLLHGSTRKLVEEISKCIVLCANCHREQHFNYWS